MIYINELYIISYVIYNNLFVDEGPATPASDRANTELRVAHHPGLSTQARRETLNTSSRRIARRLLCPVSGHIQDGYAIFVGYATQGFDSSLIPWMSRNT